MRPVPFACNCLMLASTLMLAQSGPTYPNQNRLPNVVRSGQSLPFGQHASRKSTVHSDETPQGLSFARPVTYGTGGYAATSVAIGDLNGDGKPELVVASCANTNCTGNGLVSVLLGNGDGTFKTAVTYSSGAQSPKSVAIADVNGDGKPDLVVANLCANPCVADGSVGVMLGNGDGTFQAVVTYDAGGLDTVSVTVADMNGDGKPDIVAANFCTASPCSALGGAGSVSVLLGNGDGTFQAAVTYSAGGPALSVTVGDLNGDGKPDVAVLSCGGCGSFSPGQVEVLLNNGDGTLQTVVVYNSGGTFPTSMTLADVDGDGKLDALVADNISPDGHGSGGFGVMLGNGDGTFQSSAVQYGLSGDDDSGTNNVAIADLTDDGKLDVVLGDREGIGCSGNSSMAVLPGNGDGTFQPEISFCAVGSIFQGWVASADMNGDGRPDVVIVSGSTINVFINTSTPAVLSPTSLNFAVQTPGTSSSPQTVTLTNTSVTTLALSGISITGTDASGFSETNNCPSKLATGSSCQINVTSDPQTGGALTASLNVSDNLPGSPQTVALTGTGEDFSLTASPTSNTVTPGQVGNYTVTVSPLNGFSQKVALSCSGAPAQSTCTVSPGSVTLNGTANATVSVAVVTAGASASLAHPSLYPSAGDRLALWLAFPGLAGLVLTVGTGVRSRKRHGRLLYGLAFLCLFSLAITWPACGGGSSGSGGTPSGTYTVSVTGTFTSGSATLNHTTKLTLIVQ
jgi:FG-GAP-like repeat/Cep192 domain 4